MPNGSPVPDINVGYIAAGDANAPPVLLVHGFGASGFHWRRNIGALADAGYRVYAIDLLGFGATDKPVLEYKAELWRDECAAFLREVAGCGPTKRAVVAGNSIGGYTALALASTHPELVRGCASLNGAGKFAPPEGAEVAAAEEETGFVGRAVAALVATLQRAVITASFFVTKQPARIKQVLQQVYPVYPERADDILVASIQQPAQHPDAAEVFYRIVSQRQRAAHLRRWAGRRARGAAAAALGRAGPVDRLGDGRPAAGPRELARQGGRARERRRGPLPSGRGARGR